MTQIEKESWGRAGTMRVITRKHLIFITILFPTFSFMIFYNTQLSGNKIFWNKKYPQYFLTISQRIWWMWKFSFLSGIIHCDVRKRWNSLNFMEKDTHINTSPNGNGRNSEFRFLLLTWSQQLPIFLTA